MRFIIAEKNLYRFLIKIHAEIIAEFSVDFDSQLSSEQLIFIKNSAKINNREDYNEKKHFGFIWRTFIRA